MSTTRTYALRSCTDAGLATQPQTQNGLTLRQDDPLMAHEPLPHMPGNVPFTGSTPMALYSQVVVSRGLSPLRETSSVLVMRPARGPSPVGHLTGHTPPEVRVEPIVGTKNVMREK